MRYKVTRGDDVRFDLAGILDLIGNYAGYAVGGRKIEEIEQAIEKLADFPHAAALRNEVSPALRTVSVGEKGVICFAVDDDARIIKIISVTYAGQDWQKIAKTRE